MKDLSHTAPGPLTAAEAVVAWTPVELAVRYDNPAWKTTAGCVTVGPRADRTRLAATYAMTMPIAEEGQDGALRVFQIFNTLVLEHAIAPLVAHIALLDLAEYRSNLSPCLADPSRSRRPAAEIVVLDRFRAGCAD